MTREAGGSGWGSQILFLIVGAILGFFGSVYQEDIVSTFHDWRCDGSAKLVQGKAARKEAVEAELKTPTPRPAAVTEQIRAKHQSANEALTAAYECRVPEAGLRLGQAYCFGWAVPRDSKRGWTMILEAAKKDARLSSMLLVGGRDFCPTD